MGDSAPGGGCIALGTFDGVHVGHRRILSAAKNKSTERSTHTSVLLFSSSPHGAPELFPMEERLAILRALGIARAYIFDFSELKDFSAEDFVHKILKEKLQATAVFAGFNYHFGAKAAGDAALLSRLCASDGMDCTVIDAVELCGGVVSSTRIRALLAAGEMETVNTLLSYPYYLRAEVVHGRALGRTLGLPTVNQPFSARAAIPAHGVYNTLTVIDGVKYPSVTNVGLRPTVGGESVNAETHILDYDGDLYGKTLTVEFYKMVRGERAFPSIESLQKQVESDCDRARRYFAERRALCQ